ncbi:beta-flanking protein [Marasmius fiardii PR-910]|nr:beta-flanking protein [Marasmius fiardii PR-910]
MDSFINLAKKGVEAYSESQSNVSKTGGTEYNPENRPSGHGPSLDHEEVVRTAEQHGSGDSSLFKTALGFISNNQQDHEQPLDEEHVTKAHQQAYQENNPGNLSANSLGAAAAMQTLKQFTSGSGAGASSGGSQSQLISLAMAEASKLFDKSGGSASGNKQDAVNGAAMTVMKLLVQSKFGGAQATGGHNSGGLSGLLDMASKFAK